uniref:Uncharacterized protein n=1 Tax=Rhizophora mucronata TaxID=61149 RepID=A0A2P2P4C6_RHIMU
MSWSKGDHLPLSFSLSSIVRDFFLPGAFLAWE